MKRLQKMLLCLAKQLVAGKDTVDSLMTFLKKILILKMMRYTFC